MRFCTYQLGNRTAPGLIHGRFVIDLERAFLRAFKRPVRFRDLLDFLQDGGPARLGELDLTALQNDRTVALPRHEARLRAPLRRPPKVVCVGLNYKAHAAEQNLEPPKAANVVIGQGDEIRIPYGISEQVDYEVELAAVIGTPGFRIPPESALAHVFGYTVLNDVTARDIQRGDKQWFRGKSFDTFCPMGPEVVSSDDFDPSKAPISLKVNGELRQSSNTSDLIFDVAALIAHASAAFPLETGDVISTGTPSGVGMFMNPPRWLKTGDRVEATVEGIGTLYNTVV
jgi:2-keto-4-pentenoate hydratase/2-oxohepta-3-ene-1,7-dioic acid hydratase in catechol pathway